MVRMKPISISYKYYNAMCQTYCDNVYVSVFVPIIGYEFVCVCVCDCVK